MQDNSFSTTTVREPQASVSLPFPFPNAITESITMTTFQGYRDAQTVLGLLGPFLIICGLIPAAILLKPDKLVRTIFPYINRHGSHTVMFGFIIKEPYIWILFGIMLINIYFTMAIFFVHVVIVRSNTYNPFDDFDCFNSTHDHINMNVEDAWILKQSGEHVECYAWTLNIAGAVGQATATLLFSYAVVSVTTWLILKIYYQLHNRCNNKKIKYFIVIIVQIIIYIIPGLLTAATVVMYSRRIISLLSFMEALAFCLILWASSLVCCFLVEKEPDNLEDLIDDMVRDKKLKPEEGELSIRKDVTKIVNGATKEGEYRDGIKKLMVEAAVAEWNKILISKASMYFETKDMTDITREAFEKIKESLQNPFTADDTSHAEAQGSPENSSLAGNNDNGNNNSSHAEVVDIMQQNGIEVPVEHHPQQGGNNVINDTPQETAV